jgi:hypothetical protein
MPSRKSLSSTWVQDMKKAYPNVNFQVFVDSVQYMDAAPNNEQWVPNYQKIWDATENAADALRTDGTTTAKDIMDKLNKEAQGYLDEYWASKQ